MSKLTNKLLMLFSVVVLVAVIFMPDTAYAVSGRTETIDTVEIGNLDYPVVGKVFDTTYSVPDNGVYYAKDTDNPYVTWYDQGTSGFKNSEKGELLDSYAKAQSGHYYMAEIRLADLYCLGLGQGGWFAEENDLEITFKDESMKYRCEGTKVDFYNGNEYQVRIRMYFQPDTVFNDIYGVYLSTDITDIYGGDEPFDVSKIDMTGLEKFFNMSLQWRHGTKEMQTNEKFVVGEKYILRLTLDSEKLGKHAYFEYPEFDDMAYVYLDNFFGTTYQVSPMHYVVDFEFVAKGKIDSLDVEGIINPEEYNEMQSSGFTVIAEGVTLESAEWFVTSGVEFPMEATGKFKPGTDYRLVLNLVAKPGYSFNLTKNDIACNVGTLNAVYQNSDTASIEIDFKIGAHNHDYNGEWKKDATNHWKECICGGIEQTGVHTYDAGVVTKKAAYNKTGVMTYTCTSCGNKKTETISALKYELAKKGATVKDSKGNSYKVTKSHKTNGTVTFVKPKNKKVTNVTVPATVKVKGVTYKVTAIEKNAFSGCKKLTKVTIGKNVASIGDKAFYNCKKLKTITINTTKLTAKKIGKNAFKGTNSKVTIKVPKAKYKTYMKALKAKGVSTKAKYKR